MKKKMASSTKGISIGILIFVLVIIIVYVIIMFELYRQQKFIFKPYTPPSPPPNSFYPLGSVNPLTQEEIDIRNNAIKASVGVAP